MTTSTSPSPFKFPTTPHQVLGPYFLSDSPLRNTLYPAKAKGSRLNIRGSVLASDGTPISNATLHFWLADAEGKYDNQDEVGNPLNVPLAQQRYRGRLTSAKDGSYGINCIRPGNYFDDGWKLWRPAHIHVMIEAPGFKTLVTQLYFQNDAHNALDIPGDDFFQHELVVQFFPAMAKPGTTQKGTFNFVLETN